MANYHTFIVNRVTEPDRASLEAQLHNADATIGIQHDIGTNIYKLKKNTVWTQNQINAAQNALETAPETTPQLSAKAEIDRWSISQKAFALALVRQLNTIRGLLQPPLPPITLDQVLAAIKAEVANVP